MVLKARWHRKSFAALSLQFLMGVWALTVAYHSSMRHHVSEQAVVRKALPFAVSPAMVSSRQSGDTRSDKTRR